MGEQERVFRLIPALKNAEFVRKGVMHRTSSYARRACSTAFCASKGAMRST